MNKQEFLTASLTNNLKVKILCGDGVFDTIDTLTIGNLYELGFNRITPIVRPLDSLTKECVQADYNDGKPFIPIVELLNIFNKNANSIYAPNSPSLEIDYYHNRQAEYFCAWYKVTEDVRMNILTLSSKFQYNYPFWTIKYLLEWHFWPNMPESEEVVLVTDEFNPYK